MSSQVDHFYCLPDQIAYKVLFYLRESEMANLQKVDPWTKQVNAFVHSAIASLWQGDQNVPHPDLASFRLKSGRFKIQSFMAPFSDGVHLPLYLFCNSLDSPLLIQHPTDPQKLKIFHSSRGELSPLVEVDLQNASVNPCDASGVVNIGPNPLFTRRHLSSIYRISHAVQATFGLTYNAYYGSRRFTYQDIEIKAISSTRLKVGANILVVRGIGKICDYTVLPQGLIVIQTGSSLQIYQIGDCRLIAEYACDLGDTFAMTLDNRYLVGMEVIDPKLCFIPYYSSTGELIRQDPNWLEYKRKNPSANADRKVIKFNVIDFTNKVETPCKRASVAKTAKQLFFSLMREGNACKPYMTRARFFSDYTKAGIALSLAAIGYLISQVAIPIIALIGALMCFVGTIAALGFAAIVPFSFFRYYFIGSSIGLLLGVIPYLIDEFIWCCFHRHPKQPARA